MGDHANPSSPPGSSAQPASHGGAAPTLSSDPALEVADDFDDDADSAFSQAVTSTASLSESILAYRTLHGRTFNSSRSSEYWAPNDVRQNEGLEFMYHAVTIGLGGKLFLAPIEDQADKMTVLDIGTGTGIWAIDFADAYPGSSVTGTDLSPIQPGWIPPNVQFQIDDFLEEWTWAPNHFDYVHMRSLYGSVPDWKELYSKAYRHLKPGGWLEDLESDCWLRSDHTTLPPIFEEWALYFYKAGDIMGRSFRICTEHYMRDAMTEAGFVDVTERKIRLPCGGWPRDEDLKRAGYLCQQAISQSLEGYALVPFTHALKWTPENVDVYTARFRSEVMKKSHCAWLLTTVVYGRKPLDAE